MPALFQPTSLALQTRMLQVRDGLKDSLGRSVGYLRVAVTELDHPGEGPRTDGPLAPAMSRNEIVRLVKVFASLGIRKVRLTGGEPLLRRDLETIVAGISPEVEGRVHLTTRGLLLARRARRLREAGLAGVNVGLDAADRGTYARLTGRDGLGKVLAGLEAAQAAGLKVKLNALVRRGWNEDQILPLARLAQASGLQVRFIEGPPAQDPGGAPARSMPAAEILRTLQEGLGAALEEEPAPGLEEGPARLFRLPGGHGRVGVIATLSTDACDRCNRVRLGSRGELHACLFGDRPVDLLGPLRAQASHAELVRLIRQALGDKLGCPPLRQDQAGQLATGRWQVGG